MHRPKLIATDLDGTILFNWAQTLPDRTRHLIRRVIDAGIVFLPSSGRQYGNLRSVFAPFADEIPYVADNGINVYMGDKLIHQTTMDHELGDEIVQAILSHPECEPLISGAHTCYIRSSADEFYEHMTKVMCFDITPVDDVSSDATGEPYSKLSAHYANGDLSPERFDWWRERFGTRCAVMTSGLTWLDLMPFDGNKGSGVQAVCEYLGISPDDCIAFGDAGNDLEMLEFVGCPIVVENGSPEALARARFVTPTVDEALERILDGEGFDW